MTTARLDPLTGLCNIRSFETAVSRALAHARAHATSHVLCVCALEELQAINHTYGPVTGDAVLRTVAEDPGWQRYDSDSVINYELGVKSEPRRLLSRVRGAELVVTSPGVPLSAPPLRAAREGGHVVIRVRDDGIGIAPDMLDRVFDLFEQHPQALDRSAGGLGLGLAIVRSLVHLHSGRVRATSEGIGHGSEFIVELPVAVAIAPRAGVVSSPALGPDLPRGEGEHVLIVDDNGDAARLLCEALTALGYQARIAVDGPRALRVAAEFQPAIGVLDIGLPLMDGYELARRLRARGGIRLVAVTGYGQPSDHERSRAVGFDAHLVKPIELGELARLLDRLRQSTGIERAADA